MNNLNWSEYEIYNLPALIEPAIKNNYIINIIFINTPFNTILARNDNRINKYIPIGILKDMRDKLNYLLNNIDSLLKYGRVTIIK